MKLNKMNMKKFFEYNNKGLCKLGLKCEFDQICFSY